MEKFRSSPLSIVFPWLSTLVIKFALVNGGIEVLFPSNDAYGLHERHLFSLPQLLE
jgi:hypothetical protein